MFSIDADSLWGSLVFGLFIAGAIGWMAPWFRLQWRAGSLPEATGSITSVGIFGDDNQGFRLTLHYVYEVGGQEFEGEGADPSSTIEPTRVIAAAKATVLTSRPSVAVYYDPANPHLSTLEAGSRADVIFALGLLAMLASLAGHYIWKWWGPAA